MMLRKILFIKGLLGLLGLAAGIVYGLSILIVFASIAAWIGLVGYVTYRMMVPPSLDEYTVKLKSYNGYRGKTQWTLYKNGERIGGEDSEDSGYDYNYGGKWSTLLVANRFRRRNVRKGLTPNGVVYTLGKPTQKKLHIDKPALSHLRDNYATGKLTDKQFETEVEKLLILENA